MLERRKDYKPDFTAWFVLQGMLAARRWHGVPEDDAYRFYRLLADAAKNTRLLSQFWSRLPYTFQYRLGEWVTNSGRLRHFYLRKAWIRNKAEEILKTIEMQRVIILGAGLDVLSMALAERYPHVHFTEIDMEDTQRFKQNTFAAANVPLPANVESIAGDLREPLPDILSASSYALPAAKTLWICEGLFMFLPEQAVSRLLLAMHALSAPGSRIIFTTLPYAAQGNPVAQTMQKFFLKKEGITFNWEIKCGDIPAFLKNHHYTLIEQVDYPTLHREYAGSRPQNQAVGEDIHIAGF